MSKNKTERTKKEARKAAKEDVDNYVRKGYSVICDTSDYVTLEKPKSKFSFLLFLFWAFMTGGIGAIIYLIYHFKKQAKRKTIKK